MIFLKNKSIKKRLRSLIFIIILSLVISGSGISIIILNHYMQSTNIKQLEHYVNHIYKEAVIETTEDAVAAAKNLVVTIELARQSNHSNSEIFEQLNQGDTSRLLEVRGSDGTMIYSNRELALDWAKLSRYIDQGIFVWLDGNEEEGLYVYAAEILLSLDHQVAEYIITSRQVSDISFVNEMKQSFDVDATIFYKDVRIVTTVKKDGEFIVGSRFKEDLADKLLESGTSYRGKTHILGIPYFTAYKSFGNSKEDPIGIVFIGKSYRTFLSSITTIMLFSIIVALVLALFYILLSNYWIGINIINPMKDMTEALSKVSEGTYSCQQYQRLQTQYLEFDILNDSIFRMVNRLNTSKNKLERIAYYDTLTNLPNRYALMRDIEQYDKGKGVYYLVYLGLDNIRVVNDLYGHSVGDMLFVSICEFFATFNTDGSGTKLYRVAGDEFIISFLEDISKEDVEKEVQKVVDRFREPFLANEREWDITVSLGITDNISHMDSFEELMQNAEIAMYEVKNTSKNNYVFYNKNMADKMRYREEMEEELKAALINDEFYVVFQPKLNLVTNECECFEALIRWNSPKRGLVPPSDFIEVAEAVGLIIPIGQWVLDRSCSMIKQLILRYNKPYKIAVNFSTIQINQDDFFRNVLSTLIHHQLDTNNLEIEITESVLIDTLDSSIEKLRQLNVLGVCVSIDDFGKGYSSLAYLRQLPITTLKIDKLFIDAITTPEETIIADIIELGHHMGLTIVAEGVETQVQKQFIMDAGCDSLQGYYFSKPLVYEDLCKFLDKENLKQDSSRDN